MFQSKKRYDSLSPGRIAWQKFKSNTIAMVALGWIVFNVSIATLGYLITPDSSPFANSQHLEVSAKKPGTTVQFVQIRKNLSLPDRNIFQQMLYGKTNPYLEIPITEYDFEDGEMLAKKYSGFEQFEGMEIQYSIADVLFTIDSAKTIQDSIMAYRQDKEAETYGKQDLQSKIEEENIITRTYWMGTDRFGRDMLSQIIIGARISLSVGFIAIAIALLLGVLMGSLAGFYRGRVDSFIVWLINVVWSVPTLLLVIAITFALGKGFWQIFIAVGLTMWVDVARVVRGQIISLRENEYIEAARALGLPGLRIIKNHLLPNIIGPVIVISAANFASAILIEAGLSFLGIGVQPPMPSWGNMIRENYGFIILDKAFLAVIPGICIMLLVMAFMMVGNGLRNALDKSPANY